MSRAVYLSLIGINFKKSFEQIHAKAFEAKQINFNFATIEA